MQRVNYALGLKLQDAQQCIVLMELAKLVRLATGLTQWDTVRAVWIIFKGVQSVRRVMEGTTLNALNA